MPDIKNSPNKGTIRTDAGEGGALSVVHSAISWPAIFAGLFVASIVYVGLMSLGLAVGGRSLYDVVNNQDSMRDLGFGAALWTIASAIIALYSGGHVSGRVAGMIATRVGRIQGLVIASLFFVIMFTQVGLVMGALGGGISSALSTVGSSAASSTVGQELIEDAIGDLNLKSPATDVVHGIAARLIRGDQDAALTYLSRQAGISEDEARTRMENLRTKFTATMQQAGISAAKTMRNAGWTLFFAILLGAGAGMLGGGFAANYNLRVPISTADDRALHRHAFVTSH